MMFQSLTTFCLIVVVGQSVDPPAPASSTPRSFANSEEAEQYLKAEEAADLKTFRTAFEEGQTLSVRDRLERAATVTGEVAALAEKITDKEIAKQMSPGYPTRIAIYPRTSHLIKLLGARPWIRDEVGRHRRRLALMRIGSSDLRWPTEKEQPELRRLLGDRDPDIRAMAIEALATLHDPADLQLIANVRIPASLGMITDVDTTGVEPFPSVPRLAVQYTSSSNGWPGGGSFLQHGDPLIFDFYWRSVTVNQYIDHGLHQLTGVKVTRATLDAWISKYGDTRDSFWYWQQYLQHQFDELELSVMRTTGDRFWSEERYRLQAENEAELRKSLLAELAKLDRLVEAKVLLLTMHENAGTIDLDEPIQRFFDPPWQTRLTKDELFMLLEGKPLWSDVDWTAEDSSKRRYNKYNEQLATRIMLNAENYFTPADVPRLQKLLDNPNLQLGRSGYAAWVIGISRLLPAATADNLDDPQTRDGYLRNIVRNDRDAGTRNYVLAELVRVGLPNNTSFLRDVFFAKADENSAPAKCAMILQALGKAPLTKEKRVFLVDLISDERCRSILITPRERAGDDAPRNAATKSINAHAGRRLVDHDDQNALSERSKSNAALDRIINKLNQLDAASANP